MSWLGSIAKLVYNSTAPTLTDQDVAPLQGDSAGNLKVALAAAGTAGTPSGGVQSVQGVSGGTALPTKSSIVTIAVTPTVSTAGAYAAGQVLFDVTDIASALLVNGDGCIVDSITVYDKDAQAPAIDLYLAQGNTTLGSLRAAPTITAANWIANQMRMATQIAAGDWNTPVSGFKAVTKANLGLEMAGGASSTTLRIAALAQSAGTWTVASNLQLLIGIIR